jgi:hypothetical protein
MDKTTETARMERSPPGEDLANKYGSLVLNMLPRAAPVPPSGPGDGTNELHNWLRVLGSFEGFLLYSNVRY